MRATTCWPRASPRPETMTCAPAPPNATAISRPILLVEPVTRAVLFSSRRVMAAMLETYFWTGKSNSLGVSYAAQVIDQRVERRLEVPRAPGRAKHLDAALDARDEGRRDPGGVQLRADEARGLHLGDALDEVRLPLRQESSDDLGRARRAADLGHERAKRAVPSLCPVTGHDGVPPAIPRGSGGEASEVRLLVVEDALRFVPRDLKQQFLLARREVVEDLALARAGDGPDVVQRHLAR